MSWVSQVKAVVLVLLCVYGLDAYATGYGHANGLALLALKTAAVVAIGGAACICAIRAMDRV